MGRIAVIAIVSLWVIPISILVNRVVPQPYMDEIFHIPQAQEYCRGNFWSWDPMITTPPGLYYLSLAYIASFFPGTWFTNATSSLFELCSTPILRSTNGALAIICSVLIFDTLVCLRPTIDRKKASCIAIFVSLYPVHWFFTFMYYTDVASVMAVLATYLGSLKQHYWTSAMFGALAVLIRQTNIVWVMFIAATSAISYAEMISGKRALQRDEQNTAVTKYDKVINKGRIDTSQSIRRRKVGISNNGSSSFASEINDGPSYEAVGIMEEFQKASLSLWYSKWKLLTCFAPFIVIFVLFLTFVIWNGSIVLGAKEAHVVSPHFTQILYLGLACAAAVAPLHFSISQVRSLCNCFMKNKTICSLQWLIALVAGFTAIHHFSIAHPYLLADNRHYTFYVWRKIINIHWSARYLLVPLYVYSWFSIINVLGKSQKKLWILLFFLACAAVLVPAPLVEFRYYTIPFFFLVLHSPIDADFRGMLIATCYVAVNIFTMVMFLYRPFYWSYEPGTQRFIW